MQTAEALKRGLRQGWGLGIYRLLLTLVFLLVAFNALPDFKWVIALGLLVFNQGVVAVAETLKITALAQNHADDLAERKTRHTILMASERDIWPDGPSFWAEVDRRVDAEFRKQPETPWWRTGGLTAWSLAGRLLGDLALVALAFFLSGAS